MRLTVGNRVESKFSGKIYNVSRITEDWILLEEEGGISQVLTGRKNLELFSTRWKEKEKSEEEAPAAFAP